MDRAHCPEKDTLAKQWDNGGSLVSTMPGFFGVSHGGNGCAFVVLGVCVCVCLGCTGQMKQELEWGP